jgi:hypothetical protein
MEYKPIGKTSLPEEGCYYGTECYNGPSIYVDKIDLFTGFLWYVSLPEQCYKYKHIINDPNELLCTSIRHFSKFLWTQWKKED